MTIKIGQRVWDNLLGRYDSVKTIYTKETKGRISVEYELENHTSLVTKNEISKEDGCSCPFPKNDGSAFDGVSYYCPKHVR